MGNSSGIFDSVIKSFNCFLSHLSTKKTRCLTKKSLVSVYCLKIIRYFYCLSNYFFLQNKIILNRVVSESRIFNGSNLHTEEK